VKQDMPWGVLLAQVDVPKGGDEKSWTIVTADVNKINGVHPLWLMFYCDDPKADLGMAVDWLRFE
jgi:hypothetical protein